MKKLLCIALLFACFVAQGQKKKDHLITLSTEMGTMQIILFNETPLHKANFLKLAESGFYDSTLFHRVKNEFMIQGGDPAGTGMGGPGYQFNDEIHPELDFTKPFVLAMANAGTRGGQGTNGSQFFITTGATTWLQGAHTIFGVVLDEASEAIVRAIEGVATDGGDKPHEDVVLTSVSVTATS